MNPSSCAPPGGVFTFRRVTRDDFPLVAEWLSHPHVARWWNHEYTTEAVERDFGSSADGDEPSEDHLALFDGELIGLLQYSHFIDYPEYAEELEGIIDVPDRAVSIDYLIGDPDRIGHGWGTVMIRAFVERIWHADPEVTCIIVPVVAANTASWLLLQRVGFRIVAQGNLEPDNPIDDPQHKILRLDRPSTD